MCKLPEPAGGGRGIEGLMDKPPRAGGALAPGERFGPYVILETLGSGGMGEVYRARDERLAREVAIKIVRPEIVHAPGSLARLEREARILASLHHPRIAVLFGLEEANGAPALAMELVEGQTLSERLRQKGPFAIEPALRVALQLAEAIEAAHERGIVHRDLKPGNIKLTPEDEIKVLDFGLARALAQEPGPDELAAAPTVDASLTRMGALIGTPAYMAPEQAEGASADRRADIWAFGCILFELLTGATAFRGGTTTETLRAVMQADPDWSRLPADTPPAVRRMLRRCLQKDARRRLQAIGDARVVFEELLSGGTEDEEEPRRSRPWRYGVLGAGAAAAVAIAATAAILTGRAPAPDLAAQAARFTITAPPGEHLLGAERQSLAISDDGRRIAFSAASESGSSRIYLRDLDREAVEPVAGSEGATNLFLSPDGRWIGFFSDGKLRKVDARGGGAETLADATSGFGAVWTPERAIVFSLYPSTLLSIPDAGGEAHPVSRFEPGEDGHLWPSLLPGRRTLLFGARTEGKLRMVAAEPGGERRWKLGPEDDVALPRALASGHLLYLQGGDLYAVPFDAENVRILGDAVRVLESVRQYSVSAEGALVYVAGKPPSRTSRLVWVDRDGGAKRYLDAPPRTYNQPRVEPDGERVAVDVIAGKQQVWLYEPASETLVPFTFEGLNRHPVWAPDGKRIAYMSEGGIVSRASDGSGTNEKLTELPRDAREGVLDLPYSWTPDGSQLVFVRYRPGRPSEVYAAAVGEVEPGSGAVPQTHHLFTATTADGAPQVSPDGHWVAYASEDQLGARQIYVRAFPGPGDIHQVSADGGNEPQWNRAGGELFFRDGERMMAVDISTTRVFSQGKPHELFAGPFVRAWAGYARANYDVSPDGRRFLMLEPVTLDEAPPTEIRVVLGWSEELERQVPARR